MKRPAAATSRTLKSRKMPTSRSLLITGTWASTSGSDHRKTSNRRAPTRILWPHKWRRVRRRLWKAYVTKAQFIWRRNSIVLTTTPTQTLGRKISDSIKQMRWRSWAKRSSSYRKEVLWRKLWPRPSRVYVSEVTSRQDSKLNKLPYTKHKRRAPNP